MKPFTCIAIDDEPLALQLIKRYIIKMPQLKLVQVFEDAVAASEFIRRHPVDILFIDVEMPDITGIAFVAELEVKPQVIFTTAHKKFAYEGFELDAADFLLKPIGFDRFKKAVNKAVDSLEKENVLKKDSGYCFLWSEYKQVKIIFSQIIYIESRKDYVRIYLRDSPYILSLITLKEVSAMLPPEKFIRIHRSYIIPLSEIKEVSGRKVHLHSGKILPLSNSYYSEFKELLKAKNR